MSIRSLRRRCSLLLIVKQKRQEKMVNKVCLVPRVGIHGDNDDDEDDCD